MAAAYEADEKKDKEKEDMKEVADKEDKEKKEMMLKSSKEKEDMKEGELPAGLKKYLDKKNDKSEEKEDEKKDVKEVADKEKEMKKEYKRAQKKIQVQFLNLPDLEIVSKIKELDSQNIPLDSVYNVLWGGDAPIKEISWFDFAKKINYYYSILQ